MNDPSSAFTNEDLRSMVASPFMRRHGNSASVCYAFIGFFVEVFLPGTPKVALRRMPLLKDGLVHHAPYLDVLAIPEFMAIFLRAVRKFREGKSKVT